MATCLSIQQLVGAAERLRAARVMEERAVDWLGVMESARDRLIVQPFRADALHAYRRSRDGKTRTIALVDPVERLIEEALLPILQRSLAPDQHPAMHAYVPGRSTWTAARALSAALGAGRRVIRQLDVKAYFDRIDRARLAPLVARRLNHAQAEIINAFSAAPLLLDGRRVERALGIPQGRPLSPPLANLYLAGADLAMRMPGVTYLRYGDDILIAAETTEFADAAEQRFLRLLHLLGLEANAEKTRRIEYRDEPVEYLGHLVSSDGLYERVAGERLQRIVEKNSAGESQAAATRTNRRNRTLYITEHSTYLHVQDSQIVIRKGGEDLRTIPLRNVDRVLLMAGAAMSSGLVSALVSRQIPMQIFVGRGRAYGSLVSGGLPNPLRLRAQYDLCSDLSRRLPLARSIVHAKLLAMLRRLRPLPTAREHRDKIETLQSAVAAAGDFNALRGAEGMASRVYYEGFALRIRVPDFAFRERSRKPPRDPINSLLSFTYSLLFSEMLTALLVCGLDPHPGLVHELRPNHPALASDLIEPYRILVADTFVLTLVNTRQVNAEGFFPQADKGIYMTAETRKDVLTAFEHFMTRPLGGAKGDLTPRQLLDAAAQAYLGVVLGEADALRLPLGRDDVHADPSVDEMQPPPAPPSGSPEPSTGMGNAE